MKFFFFVKQKGGGGKQYLTDVGLHFYRYEFIAID